MNKLQEIGLALKRKKGLFVSFLLSLLFWLLIKLSNENDTLIALKVNVEHFQDSCYVKYHSEPKFYVHVRGHGYGLLKAYLSAGKKHQIPSWNVVKSGKNSHWRLAYFVPGASKSKVQAWLPEGVRFINADQDTVKVLYSALEEKWLPIAPANDIVTKNGELLLDFKLQPDSLLVRGPKYLLDTLSPVPVWNPWFEGLSSVENQEIELSSTIEEISLKKRKVRLTAISSPLGQKNFTLKVGIKNPYANIQLLPNQVNLNCLGPIMEMKKWSAEDFKLQVMADSTKKFWTVELVKQPKYLERYSIQPKSLEYFILEP